MEVFREEKEVLHNDFQVFWLETLGGGWRHSLGFFFFNLIGMTGVHSIILQEIEEGRQLEEPL